MSNKVWLAGIPACVLAVLAWGAPGAMARGGGGGGHGGGGGFHGGGGGFHGGGFGGGGFHGGGFGHSSFAVPHTSNFGHFAPNQGFNRNFNNFNNFNRGNFAGRNFNRGNFAGRNFNRGRWGGWGGWGWGWGLGWPWYAWNWGYPYYGGYYYPGYYAYTYPDYYDYSGYDYSTPTYSYSYPTYPATSDAFVSDTGGNYGAAPYLAMSEGEGGQSEWMSQAIQAFQSGNYREAARLAAHESIDNPQDAKAHELASLALFADGQYRGAGMEAHAALALAPPADWATLYSYYNNLPTYQRQLNALEKFIHDNPNSPDGHFLLGYHDLMMGHLDAGKEQFAEVIKLVPKDQVAQHVLTAIQGQGAATASRPPAAAAPAPPVRK